MIERWQALPIFAGLSEETLSKLTASARAQELPAGGRVIDQGDTDSDMFILVRGQVRVSVESPLHDTRFEKLLGAPAVFGEGAMVTGEPRSGSIRAETAVALLQLSRATLEDLRAEHPEIDGVLTSIVGQRLLEADSIAKVGKYRITGRLGAGAMATVFEGVQPTLERSVALKMLSHGLVKNSTFASNFHREARLVAKLDHENIVRVHDTVEAYGTHFIVMEKLDGRTLDSVIRRREKPNWGVVRRILREICLALDYSHRHGLLHRDIKPSNVFLTVDRRVKLLDFGIAVHHEASAAGASGLVGTPWYMSPEAIRGLKLDGRADQYSLGILAFELICGDVPFDAKDITGLWRQHIATRTPDVRSRIPAVPDDLAEFVRRTTMKQPDDRFDDCKAAFDYLQAAGEAPLVERFRIATLGVSFHPSQLATVQSAMRQLEETLGDVPGVRVHRSVEGT